MSIDLYDLSLQRDCMVFVDLSLSSSLEFSEAIKKAEVICAKREKIIWDLHLGMNELLSQFHFEGIFNAYYHALKVFSQTLWAPFQQETFGCCLFQGVCDLSSRFSWNKAHYQNFIEWLTDLYGTPSNLFEAPIGESPLGDAQDFREFSLEIFEATPFCRHLKNLYSMNIFSAYLHRLAASLPEELFIFLSLDSRSITHSAFLYQLLSKERFSHLHLAVKGHQIPLEVLNWEEDSLSFKSKETTVGVCFPNDEYCLQSTLNMIRKVFTELEQRKIPYRIIPEFLMTSSWDGLDEILFLHKALSPQGKRILQGFSITGGQLVYLDIPIGLDPERSYKDFLLSKSKSL